ncbi:MAG: hypothetical protein ACOCXJ_06190, partial [Planctomycetota bacterium]
VLSRQALHAWALDLPQPAGGRVRALASIPNDFLPWLDHQDLRPMGLELTPGSAHRVSAEEAHG